MMRESISQSKYIDKTVANAIANKNSQRLPTDRLLPPTQPHGHGHAQHGQLAPAGRWRWNSSSPCWIFRPLEDWDSSLFSETPHYTTTRPRSVRTATSLATHPDSN